MAKEKITYIQKFQKRFIQKAKTAVEESTTNEEIIAIRKIWGIPHNGFVDMATLDIWLKKQKNNKYKGLSKTIKKYKRIKTNPKIFLDLLYFYRTETDDRWPDTLYLFGNEKTFYPLISEKPFPGIIHYILTNKILTPESNELQVTIGKYDLPVLRLGPNTTTHDIKEFFPIINGLIQKDKPGYNKRNDRIKNKSDRDREIRTKTGYEAVDILIKSKGGKYVTNKKNEQAALAQVRQIRRRG